MNFSELPEWAIAGPVVCKDGKLLFERHQIHQAMTKHYNSLNDAIVVESFVREHVDDYVQNPEKTLEVIHRKMRTVSLNKMK
jgi:hypothetical protein